MQGHSAAAASWTAAVFPVPCCPAAAAAAAASLEVALWTAAQAMDSGILPARGVALGLPRTLGVEFYWNKQS